MMRRGIRQTSAATPHHERAPGSRLPIRGLRRAFAAVREHTPGGQRSGPDPLLTADQVAELLQVTKAWVYAETRAKRIPYVPLGRYVRYRRSAVLAWIAALEREASSAVRVRLDEEQP